jgi:PAS domain S-box-containing protein
MNPKEKTNADLIQENKDLLKKVRHLEQLVKEQSTPNKDLAEKAARLELIEQGMLDCISQTDMEYTFLYLSPSNEYLFGYKPEEMVGTNAFDYFHPEDLPFVLAKSMGNLASGEPGRMEFRFRCADGAYLWIESTGNFIRNKNGIIESIILNSRSIAAAKASSRNLFKWNNSPKRSEEYWTYKARAYTN